MKGKQIIVFEIISSSLSPIRWCLFHSLDMGLGRRPDLKQRLAAYVLINYIDEMQNYVFSKMRELVLSQKLKFQ